VLDWTVEAMKSSFALVSGTLRGLVTSKPAVKAKKKRSRPASSR